MKQEVLVGQTDYTVLVLIRDTAGAPATGLDETDIDIAYARVETDNDVTTTDVTPASLAALTTAHTDWGFEEVSATDHPGLYRLDIADAVFASGAWSAVVSIVGTGLDPCQIEFVLVAHSPWQAIADILTDTAEIGAAGAGLTNINLPNQTMDIVGNITGNLSGSVGSVTGAVGSVTAAVTANVTQWSGTNVATPTTAGVPEVDVTHWMGVAVTAALDSAEDLGLLVETTIATLASQTSFTLTAGSADDNAYNSRIIVIQDASTAAQKAVGTVSDYTGASKTVTLAADPAIFTMAVGDFVRILATPAAVAGAAPTVAEIRAEMDSNSTQLAAIVADTNEIQISLAAGGLIESMVDDLQTEVDGIQADTEDIQSRLPAALVGGRIDATVDATGLEAGALALINAEVDTALADYDAPTKAELDAGLAAADDAVLAAVGTVDTVVDAIKVQTDKLTFTVANVLDSNVTHVNDTEVTGDGGTGTEWGPA